MTSLRQIVANSQRRPATKRLYMEAVDSFTAFAGLDPRNWTTRAVEAWRDGQLARGLQPGTVNTRLQALRYASRRYHALGYGPHFAEPVERLTEDHGRKRHALSAAQAQALVAACAGDRPADWRDQALVVVALRTGLRRSELAQLGTDTINRGIAGMRWMRFYRVYQKGGGALDVVLDDEALETLGRWSDWLAERRVRGPYFRQLRPQISSDLPRVGPPLSLAGLWGIVKARAARAGLRTVTTHTLRHTYMSLAIAAGESPTRVAASIGHRRLDQVMRYYTDLHAESDPVGGRLPSLLGRTR